MDVTILPFGEQALLAEVADVDEVLALTAALRQEPPDGMGAPVPAARTVLVRFDPRVLPAGSVHDWIERCAQTATDASAPPIGEVELPVSYDGADLVETARILDVEVDTLVAHHRAAVWTVAFTGFAPGFGYLVAEDWPFDVPRLSTPRTRVPAGAIGLAGRYAGAYPRATPGGWRLIGSTTAPLFDPDGAHPVLLVPGTRVRFIPADASPVHAVSPERADVPPGPTDGAATGITILDSGLSATVQDLGRPGRAAEGIALSGALDRGALRAANRLVGNAEDAAGVELTMGGLRARTDRDLWVAVCGARGPIHLDGEDADPCTPLHWSSGTVLEVGMVEDGVRAVLAVRGGIDVPMSAGSRATDTLAGIGPEPVRAGMRLAVGDRAIGPVPPAEPVMAAAAPDELEVVIAPGPRRDWLDTASTSALFEQVWTVGGDADRVGMRLEGTPLARLPKGELPSEGTLPGAIQVPPDGRPVILLADGPVTGGYPVIGVVTEASLDLLAQARPGMHLRFRHARPRW